jgi:hypothetical protein
MALIAPSWALNRDLNTQLSTELPIGPLCQTQSSPSADPLSRLHLPFESGWPNFTALTWSEWPARTSKIPRPLTPYQWVSYSQQPT